MKGNFTVQMKVISFSKNIIGDLNKERLTELTNCDHISAKCTEYCTFKVQS